MLEKGILSKNSNIYKLDPFLGRCGLLRVDGRIQKSIVSEEMKHPVLLARKSEIAVIIIRWCHEKVALEEELQRTTSDLMVSES